MPPDTQSLYTPRQVAVGTQVVSTVELGVCSVAVVQVDVPLQGVDVPQLETVVVIAVPAAASVGYTG